MPRFSGLALALALAALSTCSTASAVAAATADSAAPAPPDRLTVTVTGDVAPSADGTFELICHPAGGTHPAPRAACDRLDELTTWGTDPFAPVPPESLCTMQYGGPATAHVTGTWAGRPVDAEFTRTDGCEIARWDSFAPLLPSAAGA
ncbi:SSI family serine proteinase inhibitor [Streptomyces sp. NBC_00691]|uniref:SSI family serine proteinase inhibitor n=1 Tax=Streptomyces sp. NBC_00691 TaxID=2903671 RepID=UPI002E346A8D|nr:SSI family serine proteinase inhibitor [Streptomyces sp. NBC_00691]